MRILLASVDFVPHRDGVSTLSYHYARRLAEQGHEVMAVGPRTQDTEVFDRDLPFTVYRFPGYDWGWLRMIPFALTSLRAYYRHRPDIVFPMNIGYGGILFYLLSLLGSCRYVTVAYAFEFMKFENRPLLHKLYVRIYKRSLFTIAISEFTKERLVRFGVPREHIRISFPGIEPLPHDAAALNALPEANGAHPVVGTCGRLIDRKGHDLVLRALPKVIQSFPHIRYLIAGRGPVEDSLRRLAQELNVAEHVVFLGEVSDAQLAQFYASIDLFVMPSREDKKTGHAEGFGIVYLEAALYEVPSLATKSGGIPEAVKDGVTGILVEPHASDELAAAMSALLSDEQRREEMGRQARSRALNELNWDDQVDKIHSWLTHSETERD